MARFSVVRQALRARAARILAGAALALTLMGLAGASAQAAPMTFRLASAGNVDRCGAACLKVIVAEGEIVADTPERFIAFVRQHVSDRRVRAVVFMDSPGGLVVSSMRLGLLLRRLGAAVVVARIEPTHGGDPRFLSASCFSACVYAIMGASKRVVPPQSRLVVHRMFTYEMFGQAGGAPRMEKIYSNAELARRLRAYASLMGVSPDVVRTAESVAPEKVRPISQQEMRRWRLATPRF